jgi:hypothetical protein
VAYDFFYEDLRQRRSGTFLRSRDIPVHLRVPVDNYEYRIVHAVAPLTRREIRNKVYGNLLPRSFWERQRLKLAVGPMASRLRGLADYTGTYVLRDIIHHLRLLVLS